MPSSRESQRVRRPGEPVEVVVRVVDVGLLTHPVDVRGKPRRHRLLGVGGPRVQVPFLDYPPDHPDELGVYLVAEVDHLAVEGDAGTFRGVAALAFVGLVVAAFRAGERGFEVAVQARERGEHFPDLRVVPGAGVADVSASRAVGVAAVRDDASRFSASYPLRRVVGVTGADGDASGSEGPAATFAGFASL